LAIFIKQIITAVRRDNMWEELSNKAMWVRKDNKKEAVYYRPSNSQKKIEEQIWR